VLFGKRPFGHGMTQEQVQRNRVIQSAKLEFPDRPTVSQACKVK